MYLRLVSSEPNQKEKLIANLRNVYGSHPITQPSNSGLKNIPIRIKTLLSL